MEEEVPNQKTKKKHNSLNPTDLNQRQENKKKQYQNQKTNKNPYSLSPTDLNQGR